MKPFRLQKVLDYRQRLEELGRIALVAALEQEARLVLQLERAQQELGALYAQIEAHKREGIDPRELLSYEAHCGRKLAALAAEAEELDSARRQVIARREELCEASREKKLLETVKARRLEEAQLEERRRDAIVLDEIAVQSFKR
jgi:flagellar protein FliJ